MRPRVIVHSAISVDGRTEGVDVDLSAFYSVGAVWGEDVTLAGSETILRGVRPCGDEGDAKVAAPAEGDARPLLVVADGRGRVRCWGTLRQAGYWRDVAALCCEATPAEYRNYLETRGVKCVITPGARVDLRAGLEMLAARFGARVVRVDSGGTLSGALLRQGLVDEVSVMIQPQLVGGDEGRTLFREAATTAGAPPIDLKLIAVDRRGEIIWARYEVERT